MRWFNFRKKDNEDGVASHDFSSLMHQVREDPEHMQEVQKAFARLQRHYNGKKKDNKISPDKK
ncbi:hypothetical protein [Schleiferilactobacillus perolens]|jgi:hypothetical protein|uniref:Uncharacterized protein n=1 Tax=Schleiferilactobacillus perolens DSM 12744 TaxID=1423792 RepID=A0A0R1MY28_9LACO|nr:hypothetical protein [Schleiferilactobacillus perolens]KRL13086.1 hypothetical protein FD09_GL002629 [Schleiferilactobacillus perolens DSM 12744]MCI1891702.1 hypothetical protein [Schleiferilactobacillus harbinensis]MCI1912048.1 hypothetical protein [Schleiferilactobacillus harbinensis]MCI2171768.1 hypothetical protein [Schleiferilactobacillus perolens]